MAEIDGLVLIDHYKNLDDKERVAFRDKVLQVTGMGYTTFYSKISGTRPFTRAELIVIKSIMDGQDVAEN